MVSVLPAWRRRPGAWDTVAMTLVPVAPAMTDASSCSTVSIAPVGNAERSSMLCSWDTVDQVAGTANAPESMAAIASTRIIAEKGEPCPPSAASLLLAWLAATPEHRQVRRQRLSLFSPPRAKNFTAATNAPHLQ